MNTKNKNIDPKIAEQEDIELDESGWPTETSLQQWHKVNNPMPRHGQRTTVLTETGEQTANHNDKR